MRKFLLFLLVFVSLLIMLWIVGRATNSFQWFTVSSKANEPTLKLGSKFFASNLKEPALFDFICYKTETKETGKYIAVHRVCGMPGDQVQIKQGDLFINGKAVDGQLSLKNNYKMALKDYASDLNLNEGESYQEGDSMNVLLADKFVTDNQLRAIRANISVTHKDEYMTELFSHNWNLDNFGPIKIPDDTYFVLGDSRSQSLDSRYAGFISKQRVVATVLWKH